jgi:hypothetical protein
VDGIRRRYTEEESRAKKERKEGGKMRDRDVLGWGDSEVGVLGWFFRSVLAANTYT